MRRLLRALSRMLRSKTPGPPMTEEGIRRETARATSDLQSNQGSV